VDPVPERWIRRGPCKIHWEGAPWSKDIRRRGRERRRVRERETVEQGDPLPPVEKGIERDLLQLHVVEGEGERERGGLIGCSAGSPAKAGLASSLTEHCSREQYFQTE